MPARRYVQANPSFVSCPFTRKRAQAYVRNEVSLPKSSPAAMLILMPASPAQISTVVRFVGRRDVRYFRTGRRMTKRTRHMELAPSLSSLVWRTGNHISKRPERRNRWGY
jgi:hypothetical protein